MYRLAIICLATLGPVAASAQQMSHSEHMTQGDSRPTEGGQSAFAAIQEIVNTLIADPNTDWSQVNITGLRLHLIDMNNLVLRASVESKVVESGVVFSATSTDPAVTASIQRMVPAHAQTMNGRAGWGMAAKVTETGAILTVTGDEVAKEQVRALGLIGVMTVGMHHQDHHLALALGGAPH